MMWFISVVNSFLAFEIFFLSYNSSAYYFAVDLSLLLCLFCLSRRFGEVTTITIRVMVAQIELSRNLYTSDSKILASFSG